MVRILNKHQKKYVKYYWSKGEHTQVALAIQFGVSARTIKRVIDEPEE